MSPRSDTVQTCVSRPQCRLSQKSPMQREHAHPQAPYPGQVPAHVQRPESQALPASRALSCQDNNAQPPAWPGMQDEALPGRPTLAQGGQGRTPGSGGGPWRARTFRQLIRGERGLLHLLQPLLSGPLLAFRALMLVLTLHSVQGSWQGLGRQTRGAAGPGAFPRTEGRRWALSWEPTLLAPITCSQPAPPDPEAPSWSQEKFTPHATSIRDPNTSTHHTCISGGFFGFCTPSSFSSVYPSWASTLSER